MGIAKPGQFIRNILLPIKASRVRGKGVSNVLFYAILLQFSINSAIPDLVLTFPEIGQNTLQLRTLVDVDLFCLQILDGLDGLNIVHFLWYLVDEVVYLVYQLQLGVLTGYLL